MPLWLRLVRSGNTFIGYWALDVNGSPSTWNQLGAETVAMGSTVDVGLGVTSHQNGSTVTATFDHVQIIPPVEQASHFDVTASAPLVAPGSPVNITVKSLDQYNNVVTGYTGTIHFSSSDQMAGLPADYTFTAADNGVHTFTVTPHTLGNQTFTVTDTTYSTVTGGTALTVTNNAIVASFSFSTFPSPVHAGVAQTLTVTARDSTGAVLQGYRGTVHFTSTDQAAGLPADYTFTAADSGVHSFTITLNTPGTQSITVTDAVANVSGTVSNIVVVAPVTITSLTHSAFTINEGGQVTLAGQFSDPLAGQGHTVVVSWGDGSTDTTLPLGAGIFSFSASHQYAEEGNFAIRVTVRATDTSSDTVSLPVTPAGLVSWWSAEGSGTTAVDVADNNPGTLNGGVTLVSGKTGKAFSFDGNSNRGSYVEVKDAANLDSTTGTWAFWLKTTQTSSFVGLVGKNDGPGGSFNGITMQMDGGFARVEVKSGSQTLLLNPTTVHLNDGQWHQMALTFVSGGQVVLYIDGKVAATGTAPSFSFGANDPLRFGVMTDGFWTPYNGLLDDVQVYNRVLSLSDIQALYNSTAVAPAANLVDWWTGDGANTTTAPDLAGTNSGALHGGVTYTPGEVGNAFTFDGNSNRGSYVNVPDVPNSSQDSTTGTWDFWFKTTQTGVYIGLVGKNDGPGGSFNGITMQVGPDGHSRVEVKGPGPTLLLNGTTAVNDGQWHHMALTFQTGGTTVLYVDGQMQDSGTAPTFSFGANDPLRFGTMTDGFWTPLNGQLDEVQIYNRVLSASEIQSIYNAGSAGLVKGVHVSDVAVTATGGFTVVAGAGVSSTQTVAVFTDPAGAEALADYSATIDWGDKSTPSTGTISFNSSTGVFTVQGSHTYAQAGTDTVTVTVHHDTATDVTATSSADVFTPAFRVSGYPSTTTAGDSHTFTVTVQDPFGGTVAGYTGTVHFTSTDQAAGLPADYTFTTADAGTHTFSATLTTAGTQSITATDTANSGITGSQSGIVVNPAAASKFVVTTSAATLSAGNSVSVTLTAYDKYGNVATGYTGTVHFTSSDGHAVLPGDTTLTHGTGSFSVTLKTAGSQTITATDTNNSALTASAAVTVNPAAASKFVVTFLSTIDKDRPYDVAITVYDAYGNVATGYTGTVHFTSSDTNPKVKLPANYTFTAADGGKHTFSGGVSLHNHGQQSLTVTDTADASIFGTIDVQVQN
jgi:hypothetical protein